MLALAPLSVVRDYTIIDATDDALVPPAVEDLAAVRRTGKYQYLRPDAKSQVTIKYENDKPVAIDTIVLSTPLPTITNPVTIDGYSQPGAAANTSSNDVHSKRRGSSLPRRFANARAASSEYVPAGPR